MHIYPTRSKSVIKSENTLRQKSGFIILQHPDLQASSLPQFLPDAQKQCSEAAKNLAAQFAITFVSRSSFQMIMTGVIVLEHVEQVAKSPPSPPGAMFIPTVISAAINFFSVFLSDRGLIGISCLASDFFLFCVWSWLQTPVTLTIRYRCLPSDHNVFSYCH